MELPLGTPLSQRAFARLIGVNHVAVQKAIKNGRLHNCLNAAGQIVDADLARREWAANTDYTDAPHRAGLVTHAAPEPHRVPLPLTMSEAAAREKQMRADLLELKLKQQMKELVPAVDVRAEVTTAFTEVRAKLLGVPSRARQQDPGLTVPQLALIEALIREALEALAKTAGTPQ